MDNLLEMLNADEFMYYWGLNLDTRTNLICIFFNGKGF